MQIEKSCQLSCQLNLCNLHIHLRSSLPCDHDSLPGKGLNNFALMPYLYYVDLNVNVGNSFILSFSSNNNRYTQKLN